MLTEPREMMMKPQAGDLWLGTRRAHAKPYLLLFVIDVDDVRVVYRTIRDDIGVSPEYAFSLWYFTKYYNLFSR